MPTNATQEQIYQYLGDIRKAGARRYNSAEEFVITLEGEDIRTAEQCEAYTIAVVQKFVHDEADAELLLASFGLLKGYEYIRSIAERREKYYRHALLHKKWKTVQSTMQKQENDLMELLSKKLHMAISLKKEWAAFLKTIPDHMDLPVPGYQKDNTVPFPLNNLPVQNGYFVGRKDMIDEICANFWGSQAPVRIQTLSGLGGIGKTQIALQYAYDFAEDYNTIWLVNTESVSAMTLSFSAFLAQKGLMPDVVNPETVRGAFFDWFDNHDNWLLIYDNAEYASEVDNLNFQNCLPKNGDVGHILLTTRCSMAYRDEPLHTVDVFTEASAVEFLLKRTKIKDEKNAASVAERLGYLPLALEQAGAYIAENKGVGFSGYWDLLEVWGLELLESNDRLLNYKLSVAATWKLSMLKLELESAEQLLNLCAYLSPNSIDMKFILESAERDIFPATLKEEIIHPLKRNKLIADLTRYSLCSYDGSSLSMHSLLQEVVRDCQQELGKTYMLLCFGMVYQARGLAFDEPEAAAYAPHAVSVIGHFIGWLDEADEDLLYKLRSINDWLISYTVFYDVDGRIRKMLGRPLEMIEKKLSKGQKKLMKTLSPQAISLFSHYDAMPVLHFILAAFQGKTNAAEFEIIKLWGMYWLVALFERAGMDIELKQVIRTVLQIIKDGGFDAIMNDPIVHLMTTLLGKTMPELPEN